MVTARIGLFDENFQKLKISSDRRLMVVQVQVQEESLHVPTVLLSCSPRDRKRNHPLSVGPHARHLRIRQAGEISLSVQLSIHPSIRPFL